MPYFIEYTDGRVEKFEGEVTPEELGPDVQAAYTVAKIYTRESVFKAKDLTPKIVRRIRLPSGELKFKEELTADELKWYLDKRKAQLAKNRGLKA